MLPGRNDCMITLLSTASLSICLTSFQTGSESKGMSQLFLTETSTPLPVSPRRAVRLFSKRSIMALHRGASTMLSYTSIKSGLTIEFIGEAQRRMSSKVYCHEIRRLADRSRSTIAVVDLLSNGRYAFASEE